MISILYGLYLYLYLLCDKYPKSISWFPCMTVGAFYMISSLHTTAALSLFLTTTKNTQLEIILQLVFESLLLHLLQKTPLNLHLGRIFLWYFTFNLESISSQSWSGTSSLMTRVTPVYSPPGSNLIPMMVGTNIAVTNIKTLVTIVTPSFITCEFCFSW